MPNASYRAAGHTHVQSTPSNTWTINHGLGRTPSVTVSINYGGKLQVILPKEIEIVSSSQVIVRFSNNQTGQARLS